MADYRTETVVTPDIPASDMTPLERLMLSLVFDEEAWSDGTFFSTWNSPNELISPREDELRVALEGSPGSESRFNEYIANLLAAFDAKDEAERGFYIEIDLTTSQGGSPRSCRILCGAPIPSRKSWSGRRLPARRCAQTALAAVSCALPARQSSIPRRRTGSTRGRRLQLKFERCCRGTIQHPCPCDNSPVSCTLVSGSSCRSPRRARWPVCFSPVYGPEV